MKKTGLYIQFLIVIAGVAVLSYFAYNWNYSRKVKNIKIAGNSIISDTEIQSKTAMYVGSKKQDLSLNRIKKSIEENPYIKKAIINFNSQNELEVKIVERTPVAVIEYDSLRQELVDESGSLMKANKSIPTKDLLKITGFPANRNNNKQALKNAIFLITELKKKQNASLGNTIRSLSYDKKRNILRLNTTSGSAVLLSGGNITSEKIEKLKIFFSSTGNTVLLKKFKTLDARWSKKIVAS